ncbi:DHHC palmitoyltransferase-domain-containing protein [Syncephalis plumigaleata]|nr:DHHC palmitoyltransferase-domain-containing protein [Syncephalis plumigaleata]
MTSMFPVFFCLALIGWSYYGFAISLCSHLIWHDSAVQGVLYLLIYHPILILFTTSFIRCVRTHPGRPSNLMSINGDEDEDKEDDATVGESTIIDAVHGQVSRSRDTGMELGHRVIDYRQHSRTSSATEEDDNDNGNDDDTTRIDLSNLNNESRMPLITTAAPLNTTSVNSTLISSSGSRQALSSVITVKEDGQPRFCRKCQLNKPDRTHHCSVCGEINNCVGHRNQKFFYLFIFWGAIYTSFVGLASIPPVYNVLISDNGLLILNIHWLFVVLCGCIFGLCLMGFVGYHSYLLLTNQTTIETFQRNRYRRLGGTLHYNHRNRLNLFDLGWRANLCQVLGPIPLLWLIPVQNTPGDGYAFKLNERAYEAVSIHEMLV